MEKILAFTLIAFIVSIGLVSAQTDMSLEVVPKVLRVNPGEMTKFTVTAYSPESVGGLYLFVTGSPSHWINMGTSYIDLPVEDPVTVKIEFYPNDVPGTYEYEIKVQSHDKPELVLSEKVELVVLGEGEVSELDGEIKKSADSVDMLLELDSGTEEEVTAEFSLVSSSKKTMYTYTKTLFIEGRTNLTHEIPLSAAPFADTYTAKAEVKGTDISLEKSFMIEPVHRMVKTEEESTNPLFQEFVISVSNEGNVIEEDYTVSANVPTGFVTFSQEPESCDESVCEWTVSKLNPEEAMQIVYRVQYWPLIAEGLLIAVLLGVFVFFGRTKINTPALRKKVEMGEDGSYMTVLEIKNAGKKITDVIVKDEVSPLFNLKDDFETVKPAVKHHKEMTELVWSLPAIEPGDHRIIHYKMNPVVKGSLKVPKAFMRYSTGKGGKSKVQTKELNIAA